MSPIDRNGGESGVYATHFTWYQGIQSIYNNLSGNQSMEFTHYVLRQYSQNNPEFVPTTIRTTATWNANVNGGAEGTPAPNFVYHQDPAGEVQMTPSANTMWWLTNNMAFSPSREAVLKDIVRMPLLASASFSPTSRMAMGTYANHLFRVDLPVGWEVKSTLSNDQFVFNPADRNGPVVRVFILPNLKGVQGKGQFETRWHFRGKAITAEAASNKAPIYQAEGPDNSFANHWSTTAGMETKDSYVKILHVTVPDGQRAQWEPTIRHILQSFSPTPSVYK